MITIKKNGGTLKFYYRFTVLSLFLRSFKKWFWSDSSLGYTQVDFKKKAFKALSTGNSTSDPYVIRNSYNFIHFKSSGVRFCAYMFELYSLRWFEKSPFFQMFTLKYRLNNTWYCVITYFPAKIFLIYHLFIRWKGFLIFSKYYKWSNCKPVEYACLCNEYVSWKIKRFQVKKSK